MVVDSFAVPIASSRRSVSWGAAEKTAREKYFRELAPDRFKLFLLREYELTDGLLFYPVSHGGVELCKKTGKAYFPSFCLF